MRIFDSTNSRIVGETSANSSEVQSGVLSTDAYRFVYDFLSQLRREATVVSGIEFSDELHSWHDGTFTRSDAKCADESGGTWSYDTDTRPQYTQGSPKFPCTSYRWSRCVTSDLRDFLDPVEGTFFPPLFHSISVAGLATRVPPIRRARVEAELLIGLLFGTKCTGLHGSYLHRQYTTRGRPTPVGAAQRQQGVYARHTRPTARPTRGTVYVVPRGRACPTAQTERRCSPK